MRLFDCDLLIADVKIPNMERLLVIHEARCLRSDLPVIGFSKEASTMESTNRGVVDYLTKPLKIPTVLAATVKALGE